MPLVQAGTPDPCVVPGKNPLAESSSHPWASQCSMGEDILSRQGLRPGEFIIHLEVVKQIWRVFGQAQVDLFATQETSQYPLWFSLTPPAPWDWTLWCRLSRGFVCTLFQ